MNAMNTMPTATATLWMPRTIRVQAQILEIRTCLPAEEWIYWIPAL